MSQLPMTCWICGKVADSREHKTKRSDLKSVYGPVSQTKPLYYHNEQRRNVRIGSLDAKLLKSPAKICSPCNTTRTQPHDLAWARFSTAMRLMPKRGTAPDSVRANAAFKYDTHRMMLNVHLYFLKLFGCHISEATIPIDLHPFSVAIQTGTAHPNVYLGFCRIASRVGMSDIHTLNTETGTCAFATWFYEIDNLAVNIMYALPGEKREGLVRAWHPRMGTNKVLITKLG